MSVWRVIEGDCRERLAELPDESVQCCVTSPPYWGLRDYGSEDQLGLEATPQEYVAHLVEVLADVRRVLRADGTLWLNLGDSYASSPPGNKATGVEKWATSGLHGAVSAAYAETLDASVSTKRNTVAGGLKPKDLCMVPARVALALQADGWYLRSDIVWSKPNPMPESVTDRPTKAHEYLFLLSKAPRYFYDADAIREDAAVGMWPGIGAPTATAREATSARGHDEREPMRAWPRGEGAPNGTGERHLYSHPAGRNRRSVWTVATQPFSGWGLADRRVRVAADDADDDTERIASPDCPVHAGRSAPAPTARRGGRAAAPSRRSPDTFVDPAQGLLLDSAPTGPPRAPDSAAGSSDSPAQPCAPAATPRSTGSRRTGPDPATSPACTPSAETAHRTGDTSASLESSEPRRGTNGRSNGGADSADPRASGTTDRTAHKPSSSAGSACTCEFYKVERSDHFATFPPKLIEPCVLAGCPENGTVLDPFAGAGTTGLVALRHHRSFIGIELNAGYCELARERIRQDAPLLNTASEAAA